MASRVAVCIPTHNRREYLKECVESILGQTYQDFRIIILDNASDQGVEDLVSDFKDSRIAFYRNEINIGSAANIQKALDIASTEFVTVFHDDDCMHPKLLETQLSIFDGVPSVVFVATLCNLIYEKSEMRTFSQTISSEYKILWDAKALVKYLLAGLPLGFGGIMYRRSVTRRARMDIERFSIACDRPFLVCLAETGPCVCVSAALYNARQHCRQDSADNLQNAKGGIEVLRFYREKLLDSWDPATSRQYNIRATEQLLRIVAGSVLNAQIGMAELWNAIRGGGLIHPFVFLRYGLPRVTRIVGRRVLRRMRPKGGVAG